MPSTEEQRAKERRSRQLDMMSDVENVDIRLGSYSRDDERNEQSENELNLGSGSSRPQQNSNLAGEDCRGLNTTSRENSETTIETIRIIGDEIASQVQENSTISDLAYIYKFRKLLTPQLLRKCFRPLKTAWLHMGELILPWRTTGPVGYKGIPKYKPSENEGKSH